MTETDAFAIAMRTAAPRLKGAHAKVVAFIDANRAYAVTSSAAEIAASTETSDATVIRSAQALGFGGMANLKKALAAALDRGSTPADNMRRTLVDAGANVDQAIGEVFDAHDQAMVLLRTESLRKQIAAAASLLATSERIVLFGIGPSSHLARYAAMMIVRGGRATSVLDATGSGLADQLLGMRKGDGVLMLASGKPYVEATAVVAECQRKRIPVALITDKAGAGITPLVDTVISAGRGRSSRSALHAATMVVLEALILALAVADKGEALRTLERLNRLRELVVITD